MTSEPSPQGPIYFCDRNLGKKFPYRLREQGLFVKLHDELFPPDTPDETWIPQVSAQGWVILTLDARIRYRPGEKVSLRLYGAKVILFTQPKKPGPDWLLVLAEEFAKAQEKVLRFLERTPPPFVGRFHVDPEKRGGKRYRLLPLEL
ncbi:hypothetical protein [Thermus thalpophilus]|uniref:PIN-like domain-containing protein n=1 Tax=Thermus thalpophilus TaxID=2908147 RepID=UPI001FA94857|nr:hypothetical protein [Thermus thalpophilus]